MSCKLYKARRRMAVSGLGVMIFGFWTFIKMIMETVFRVGTLGRALAYLETDTLSSAITLITVIVIIFPDVLLRLYVAVHAARVSKGKEAGRAYLVLAAALAALSVFSVGSNIFILFSAEYPEEVFAEMAIEATSLLILVDLLRSAYDIHRLEKEAEDAA